MQRIILRVSMCIVLSAIAIHTMLAHEFITETYKSIGNKLYIDNDIIIPEGYGASNRRLILTPFLIDCQTEDTVGILAPIVFDGKKYKCKSEEDLYASYVNRKRYLSKEKFLINIRDTVLIPDVMKHYGVLCKLIIKEKDKDVYEQEYRLITCKRKRPLQFLEWLFPEFQSGINPDDDIANKLIMHIRSNKFEDVCILADKLPHIEKYKMVKAFANCLCGYYDYRFATTIKEMEERKETFYLVKNSSPMNNVVMCMAMETDFYNAEARKLLETIPSTTQTKYMKLQLFVRENKLYDDPKMVDPFSKKEIAFKDACKMLKEIIMEDPEFRIIVEHDGEFTEEFIEYFNESNKWN